MEDYPFTLFWEGGDSVGDYRSEAEALQAVATMVQRGEGEAAINELVLAKVEQNANVVRIAEGRELAAMAERGTGQLSRTA